MDIFHLHNADHRRGGGEIASGEEVLGRGRPGVREAARTGQDALPGITAVGDTAALHQVIDAARLLHAQVSYNMLNPSAAVALPADIRRRIMAGCSIIRRRPVSAWSASACWPAVRSVGVAERHPIASPPPDPIGSATRMMPDLERARRLMPLVHRGLCRQPGRSCDPLRHHA